MRELGKILSLSQDDFDDGVQTLVIEFEGGEVILEEGVVQENRTGVDTLSVFGCDQRIGRYIF